MLLPGRQCAPLVGVQELAKDSVVGVNLGCLHAPAKTTSVSEKVLSTLQTAAVSSQRSRTSAHLLAAVCRRDARVGPVVGPSEGQMHGGVAGEP